MAYEINEHYIDEAKISEGKGILAMIADVENVTYGAYLAIIAKSKDKLPDGDDLWVKSDHGEILNKGQAWAIKVLEEYDLDSEEGQKVEKLSEMWTK